MHLLRLRRLPELPLTKLHIRSARWNLFPTGVSFSTKRLAFNQGAVQTAKP